METDHSGFDIIKYVRETLRNNIISIVVRSGQPAYHGEDLDVIHLYDIDDYTSKAFIRLPDMAMSLSLAMRRHMRMKELRDRELSILTTTRDLCNLMLDNAQFMRGAIELSETLENKGYWLKDQIKNIIQIIEEEIK